MSDPSSPSFCEEVQTEVLQLRQRLRIVQSRLEHETKRRARMETQRNDAQVELESARAMQHALERENQKLRETLTSKAKAGDSETSLLEMNNVLQYELKSCKEILEKERQLRKDLENTFSEWKEAMKTIYKPAKTFDEDSEYNLTQLQVDKDVISSIQKFPNQQPETYLQQQQQESQNIKQMHDDQDVEIIRPLFFAVSPPIHDSDSPNGSTTEQMGRYQIPSHTARKIKAESKDSAGRKGDSFDDFVPCTMRKSASDSKLRLPKFLRNLTSRKKKDDTDVEDLSQTGETTFSQGLSTTTSHASEKLTQTTPQPSTDSPQQQASVQNQRAAARSSLRRVVSDSKISTKMKMAEQKCTDAKSPVLRVEETLVVSKLTPQTITPTMPKSSVVNKPPRHPFEYNSSVLWPRSYTRGDLHKPQHSPTAGSAPMKQTMSRDSKEKGLAQHRDSASLCTKAKIPSPRLTAHHELGSNSSNVFATSKEQCLELTSEAAKTGQRVPSVELDEIVLEQQSRRTVLDFSSSPQLTSTPRKQVRFKEEPVVIQVPNRKHAPTIHHNITPVLYRDRRIKPGGLSTTAQ